MMIIAHLNLNSIRNKFTCLAEVIRNHIDILMISETKINVHNTDRNSYGGGIV